MRRLVDEMGRVSKSVGVLEEKVTKMQATIDKKKGKAAMENESKTEDEKIA